MKHVIRLLLIVSYFHICYCSELTLEMRRLEQEAWSVIKQQGIIDPWKDDQTGAQVNLSRLYDILPIEIKEKVGSDIFRLRNRSLDTVAVICEYVCQGRAYFVKISSRGSIVTNGVSKNDIHKFENSFYIALMHAYQDKE